MLSRRDHYVTSVGIRWKASGPKAPLPLGALFASVFRLQTEERQTGGTQVSGGVQNKTVLGNRSLASVTIEDGFGFEAVVPVKSPIKSSPAGRPLRLFSGGFFVLQASAVSGDDD